MFTIFQIKIEVGAGDRDWERRRGLIHRRPGVQRLQRKIDSDILR
jgi:hypothetical protein